MIAMLPLLIDSDEELLIQLVVQGVAGCVFAIICAVMAQQRGRSAVGWFFIGLFFTCMGLVILLLIPNPKEEAAKQRRRQEETRRLREQLKKERQVADERHAGHAARLGVHDRALGVDTRPTEELPPPLPGEAPPQLPPAAPAQWHYGFDGKRHGPVTAAQLRTLWLDQRIPDNSLVWCEGMAEWRPIGEVADFLDGAGG